MRQNYWNVFLGNIDYLLGPPNKSDIGNARAIQALDFFISIGCFFGAAFALTDFPKPFNFVVSGILLVLAVIAIILFKRAHDFVDVITSSQEEALSHFRDFGELSTTNLNYIIEVGKTGRKLSLGEADALIAMTNREIKMRRSEALYAPSNVKGDNDN